MLGIEKPLAVIPELPDPLQLAFTQVDAMVGLDKEAKFLHQAALAYNYRRVGLQPIQKKDLSLPPAETEIKSYCSKTALRLLADILSEDSMPLLSLWLEQCAGQQTIVTPHFIPEIFGKVLQQPALKDLAFSCIGERGYWLSKLNPDWDILNTSPLSEEEIWSAGRPAERVALLKQIRQMEPERGRDLLMQTWVTENAGQRLDFLQVMRVNSSAGDLPWLETLLTEKSQRIKDEVLSLLKSIPESGIVRQYETILKTSVMLKQEKALLGMVTKTSIRINLPDVLPEELFKTGIGKLAGPKSSYSDEDYVVYQLIECVPPSFWHQQFQAAPAAVVSFFEKHANAFLPALGRAVVRFQQREWVSYFMDLPGYQAGLVGLMTADQQDKYWFKFLDSEYRTVLQSAASRSEEWSPDFAIRAFRYLAGDLYTYNKHFYNQHIHLIPASMWKTLDNDTTQEAMLTPSWERMKVHVLRLLELKQQITQVFNDKTG